MWDNLKIWGDFFLAILPMSIAAVIVVWYIRRNHLRSKSGWTKEEIIHPFKRKLDEFSGELMTLAGGALCVELFQISFIFFFIPAIFLMAFNHWNIWVPPTKQDVGPPTQLSQ